MSFLALLAVTAVALLGPLLSWATRWRAPLLVGQIIGGVLIGRSALGLVDASDPMFTLLADIGFALTMFVAGTQVPLREPGLRPLLLRGAGRALLASAAALGLGALVAHFFGSPHWLVYAVVLGSSSAALVLPAMRQVGLAGPEVTATMAQVALTDTVSMVLLPLVLDPGRAGRMLAGAALIAGCAAALVIGLRWLARRGMLRAEHRVSHHEGLALELRVTLVILFALAAIAAQTAVSIMIAGFATGLAITAVGEPRRLAKQVFALSEGFFSPLFYVWLGASLSIVDLWRHPETALLGVVLGAGGILAHLAGRLVGQPVSLAALGGAMLGVPVAAATIGTQTGALADGEPTALVVAALTSVLLLASTAALARRRFGPPSPTPVAHDSAAPGARG